jgi:hypothetical protein
MPEAAWTPALDADGRGRDGAWVFATDQPGRDLARLELRHRRHARVEDPRPRRHGDRAGAWAAALSTGFARLRALLPTPG